MKAGWTDVALSDVASINQRLINLPSDDALVSFVQMADLIAAKGRTTAGERRQFREVAKGYTHFRRDDILVAKITPCFENGKIGRATIGTALGAGSTEFHVVRPDPKRLDAAYALHFLRHSNVRRQGILRMTGSAGQRRVPGAFLQALSIPLPPLAEQRRIAQVLDAAHALCEKRQSALSLLKGIIGSVFVSMFGDPVTNPREWPSKDLGSLGKLERGLSTHRPRNAPELLGGPYPLIQTGDVARSEGLITRYSSSYSDIGLGQSRLWPAGTLCITIAANIAKTGLLTFDACFPDSVVGFTADSVTTTYIQAWLSFLQPTLERSAPESAQKNINLAILRQLHVPTPPRQQQAAFADTVELIRAAQRLHSNNLAQLEALFASIRGRAFNGDL